MTKTNYDQLENFKIIEKKIEVSSINPIAAFDQKVYDTNYIIQLKGKKLIELKGKLSQSSENNSSSVNPLLLPDIMKLTLSEENVKQPI